MSAPTSLPDLHQLCVETMCRIDGKSRISLPEPLQGIVAGWNGTCRVVKERPGALSLWSPETQEEGIEQAVEAALKKYEARRQQKTLSELMVLGRLRSTRETTAKIDGRARMTIPATFREFLGVEPEGQVTVVAATVCIEIWRPEAWIQFVEERISDYRRITDELLD